jgi:hypothetical protein
MKHLNQKSQLTRVLESMNSEREEAMVKKLNGRGRSYGEEAEPIADRVKKLPIGEEAEPLPDC